MMEEKFAIGLKLGIITIIYQIMKQNEQEGGQLQNNSLPKSMLKYTTSNKERVLQNQLPHNDENIQQSQKALQVQQHQLTNPLKSKLNIERLENEHQVQYVKLKLKKFENQVVYYKPHPIKWIEEGKVEQNRKSKEKPEIDGKWAQYLQYWYNRYCKTGYTLGRNPTFENIKQKSSAMKASNFVEFCRDFKIDLSLKKLMEIFKSATNYKSTMTIDDFFSSIRQISSTLFSSPDSTTNPAEENEFLVEDGTDKKRDEEEIAFQKSPQWLHAVLFLQINNQKLFKKKINELDAKKKLGKLMNVQSKTIKQQYEPKCLNGRVEQGVKDELRLRKLVKNEQRARFEEEKKVKRLIESRRFQQFNVISISEKKIFKGGYMTPKKADGSLTKVSDRQSINPIQNSKSGNASFLNSLQRAQSRVDYNSNFQNQRDKMGQKGKNNSYLYYMSRRNKYQYESQRIQGLNLNPVIKIAKQSLQLKQSDVLAKQYIPQSRYNENSNDIQQTYLLEQNGNNQNQSQNQLLNFIQDDDQQQDQYLNKFTQNNNKPNHFARRRRVITYN